MGEGNNAGCDAAAADLARIAEALKHATPGDWTVDRDCPFGVHPRVYGGPFLIAEIGNAQNERQDQWEADAAYIDAVKPTRMALVLAHVADLTARAEKAERATLDARVEVERLGGELDALSASFNDAERERDEALELSAALGSGAEFQRLMALNNDLVRDLTAARARIAELEKGLRAFLHLTKPSAEDPSGSELENVPDSHPFELVWGADGSGYPQITAGQIRRAHALVTKEPPHA